MRKLRKSMTIAVVLLWIITLAGCESIHERTMRNSVEYAESHIDLLESCAQELQDVISESLKQTGNGGYSAFRVEPIKKTTMRLTNTISETETTIESEYCQEIFGDGCIKYISIYIRDAAYTVVYTTGGHGIGPATSYYAIEYITTGEVSDLWWYNENMTFVAQENGMYGKQADGDNSFFYFQITDDLYYCEASF